MSQLANNLKLLMTQAELSENGLAKRINIPQQVINRILTETNQNPTLKTLSAIANYFEISISELLGDIPKNTDLLPLNKTHFGWQKIPFIPIKNILNFLNGNFHPKKTILTDTERENIIFATEISDNSMEPRFKKGSILILEKDRAIKNGDFILFEENNIFIFRQIWKKENDFYVRCLNPKHPDFHKKKLEIKQLNHLFVLAQARTVF